MKNIIVESFKESSEVYSDKKSYNLIDVLSDEVFDKLYKSSALTFEGLSTEDASLIQLIEFLEENDIGFKKPLKIYSIKGDIMNEKYDLSGDNKYPDDLNIVSIDLNDLSNIGILSILRLQVGARWFDDIVDNNARREGKLDDAEEAVEHKADRCDDVLEMLINLFDDMSDEDQTKLLEANKLSHKELNKFYKDVKEFVSKPRESFKSAEEANLYEGYIKGGANVGDTIKIIDMDGEPNYDDREGVIEHIDSIGQLHGTWGGLAVNPKVDSYRVIKKAST